jgi:hypothetical protein
VARLRTNHPGHSRDPARRSMHAAGRPHARALADHSDRCGGCRERGSAGNHRRQACPHGCTSPHAGPPAWPSCPARPVANKEARPGRKNTANDAAAAGTISYLPGGGVRPPEPQAQDCPHTCPAVISRDRESAQTSARRSSPRMQPPYLYRSVTAIGSLWGTVAWFGGAWACSLSPDSCRVVRAGGWVRGRAAPAQRRRGRP